METNFGLPDQVSVEDIVKQQVSKLSEALFKEEKSIHSFIYSVLPREYKIPDYITTIEKALALPEKTHVVLTGYMDDVKIHYVNSNKIANIEGRLYKDGFSIPVKWTVSKAKANGFAFAIRQKIAKDPITKNPPLIQVSGKIKSFSPRKGFVLKFVANPEITKIASGNKIAHDSLFKVLPEPKYRLTKGVSSRQIQETFREIVHYFKDIDKSEFMPVELEKKLGLLSLKTSLAYTHGMIPVDRDKFEDFIAFDGFRKRILAEKVWATVVHTENLKTEKLPSNFTIQEDDVKKIKNVLSGLPFQLTGDQKKAIWGILKNIESSGASKSLLFGDVGTGKTMVSLLIASVFSHKGYQSAIMAPTAILAKQHYEEAKKIFGDRVFLVYSKTKASEKRKIEALLQKGEPIIVYGTSSLNNLPFTNLGFIVIDEEQKFGVEAKERLYKNHFPNAHLLFMTATPLPRTLTGAIFSDFKAFTIKEKPKQQLPRITTLIDPSVGLDYNMKSYIVNALRNGEQALIIVPSIESEESFNTKAAEEKYKNIFPGFEIHTVHGQMDNKKIESVMESFIEGKFPILIATTMVDAGFSNKNLSFVFIENPERFGIAQMHQIRGRVGRGERQGYCFLCPTRPFYTLKEETRQRLETVLNTEDGFYLSSMDMKLRGTGDLLGTAQSRGEINLLEWEREIKAMKEYLSSDQKG